MAKNTYRVNLTFTEPIRQMLTSESKTFFKKTGHEANDCDIIRMILTNYMRDNYYSKEKDESK